MHGLAPAVLAHFLLQTQGLFQSFEYVKFFLTLGIPSIRALFPSFFICLLTT